MYFVVQPHHSFFSPVCYTHTKLHTVPVHGEIDILQIGTLPEGIGCNSLDEISLQVEILQLAQAPQHPLCQVSQFVKAHLENLGRQRQVGLS